MVRYSFLVRLSHPLLHAGFYPGAFLDHSVRPRQHVRQNCRELFLTISLHLRVHATAGRRKSDARLVVGASKYETSRFCGKRIGKNCAYR